MGLPPVARAPSVKHGVRFLPRVELLCRTERFEIWRLLGNYLDSWTSSELTLIVARNRSAGAMVWTPLHTAARDGDTARLRRCVESIKWREPVDVNSESTDPTTPLGCILVPPCSPLPKPRPTPSRWKRDGISSLLVLWRCTHDGEEVEDRRVLGTRFAVPGPDPTPRA